MCDVSPTHALAHARAHAQNQTLTVQVSVQKWSCTVTCLSRMSAPGSNSSRFAMAWPWRIFEPQTDCRTRQRPWTRRTICTSHADAGLSTSNPKPRSLVRDGQTSPHRPRLVVSRSTCLHSPPPHANVIGPITSKLPVIKHTPKSDSTVESLPERFLCRAAARCEWVSRWLWDCHGHGVCNRNHLLACCHAATFLHAGFGVH